MVATVTSLLIWPRSIISKFDAKAPPPKTPAFWEIVRANRTTEESELQDIIDDLGNPDAITLNQIELKASHDFLQWLLERKNRKAFSHRLELCGYGAVNNESSDDGLWRINGRRQVIYTQSKLPLGAKIKAAEELKTREEAGPDRHVERGSNGQAIIAEKVKQPEGKGRARF